MLDGCLSGEHPLDALDGPAAHRAALRTLLLQLLGARLARAHVHARSNEVVLGCVHTHHAQCLLRPPAAAREGRHPAEPAPAASLATAQLASPPAQLTVPPAAVAVQPPPPPRAFTDRRGAVSDERRRQQSGGRGHRSVAAAARGEHGRVPGVRRRGSSVARALPRRTLPLGACVAPPPPPPPLTCPTPTPNTLCARRSRVVETRVSCALLAAASCSAEPT